eukprot:10169631-Ditylum_brightwellii.AAC.1
MLQNKKTLGATRYMRLHRAYFGGASVDVVSALLNARPAAIKQKDDGGCAQLHGACSGGASVDIAYILLSV